MEEREREKSTLGASSQRRTEAEAKGGQPESFRETLGSSGNVPQAACGDLTSYIQEENIISEPPSGWIFFKCEDQSGLVNAKMKTVTFTAQTDQLLLACPHV